MDYVGILDEASGTWGVRFPDVDGCVGAGPSPEAAIADATVALRDVLAHRRRAGLASPDPTPLVDILSAGIVEPGETTVLIPVVLDSGRTVRANLTFDAALLEAIDTEAGRRGVTRSAFIASAAREKIEARR